LDRGLWKQCALPRKFDIILDPVSASQMQINAVFFWGLISVSCAHWSGGCILAFWKQAEVLKGLDNYLELMEIMLCIFGEVLQILDDLIWPMEFP
jgi:hypothetical protein